MDTEKDYYAILGVLPSIDEVALAAVYRALLKKYHPDVFKGSKQDAERRTRGIIEAYEILGYTEKRKAYDNARKQSGFGTYRQEDDTPTSSVADLSDWEVVKKYYPATEEMRVTLQKLSPSLAFTFQITILEKKLAANAITLEKDLENEFLQRYFGTNTEVQRFVKYALIEGRRDVAKEANRAIKVLGTPADARSFIERVRRETKYGLSPEVTPTLSEPAVLLPSKEWRDKVYTVIGIIFLTGVFFIPVLYFVLYWAAKLFK